MNAFVLSSGARWSRKSLRWALQRLQHRGRPLRVDRSTGWTLFGFGETPAASRDRETRLWTWGVDESAHRCIFEDIDEVQPTCPMPLRFPGATILIHRSRTGRLECHLGVDARIPIYYARRGRSLFMAPEPKAFSDLPGREFVKQLNPGATLRFDPALKEVNVENGAESWRPVPLTTLSYEACREKLSGLLDQAAIELGEQRKGPLAIALSGGLDSTLAAWLLNRAGIPFEAFTVWFDSGSAAPPPDLVGARLTAETFEMPLNELRIGPEDIEELAREVVYLIEETYWRHVETGTYVLRLVRELKARGYDSVVTGLGADSNFAGRVFPSQLGENFQKSMADWRRKRFVLGTLAPTLGIGLLSPFFHPAVAEFSRSLPQTFLVEEIDGKLWGKKILRDTFAARLPSPLANEFKDFPFRTAGGEALFESRWGARKKREARYARWKRELLPLPRFRSRSALGALLRHLGFK